MLAFLSCFLRHSILSESSLTEEVARDEQHPGPSGVFPGPVERGGGTVITVPGSMLRNIRRYREDYEAYLRVVAHEAVGSFNPWAVASRYKLTQQLTKSVVHPVSSFCVVEVI